MRQIFAVLVSLGGVSVCNAVPITFIHEGSGSGTLGGMPFTNRSFVITAHGDTANRLSDGPDIYSVDHSLAEINLNGIGTFALTTGTRTFVNQSSPIVGFSRAGISGLDLFNGPIDAVYATWDMLSSIGPHSGPGFLRQWLLEPNINTTGGALIFDDAANQATFTARIVPEPGAALLAVIAAILLIVRTRRF